MQFTPILKRRTTHNQSLESSFVSIKGQRRKTFSHFPTDKKKKKDYKDIIKQPPINEEQYRDLTLQCLNKNYNVCNIKPYGMKVTIQDIKNQINNLEGFSVKKEYFLNQNKKPTVSSKLQNLISRAANGKKKKKKRIRSELFIKSDMQDDHLNLIEDYNQDEKIDQKLKRMTFSHLNKRISDEFTNFADANQLTEEIKNQSSHTLLHYKKKQQRVVVKQNEDNYEKLMMKKQNNLDLNKNDYGLYSRSTNKTFNSNIELKVKTQQSESSRNTKKNRRKTFYGKYLKSYGERQFILKNCLNNKTGYN